MKAKKENQSKNGVKVIVYKYDDGSVVEADCECFGHDQRAHSNMHCPNRSRSENNA